MRDAGVGGEEAALKGGAGVGAGEVQGLRGGVEELREGAGVHGEGVDVLVAGLAGRFERGERQHREDRAGVGAGEGFVLLAFPGWLVDWCGIGGWGLLGESRGSGFQRVCNELL